MIGRFGASLPEAWPCWPLPALGASARAPTPAATAPKTDVFTKSRRENVMDPSWGDRSVRLPNHLLRQIVFRMPAAHWRFVHHEGVGGAATGTPKNITSAAVVRH